MARPRDRRRKLSQAEILSIRKKKAEKNKEKENIKWHWSIGVFLIGMVVGIFSFAVFSQMVVISWIEILLIILTIGAISFFAQYKYFKKKNVIADTMSKAMPFYVMYNIVGAGFIGIFLFFTLNLSLASNEIVYEYYSVIGVDPEYKILGFGSVVFLLEDDMYHSDVDLRALPYRSFWLRESRPFMEYKFKQGFFGYKIKVDHKLVKEPPRD